MSRHRDVRNMDYTDEYDGYDDVYGHSVDDDYYISPSHGSFIYNRESSRDENIQEEDEQEAELTDDDKAKLESCIDQIKDTLDSNNLPRNQLIKIILKHDYNMEIILNEILELQTKEPEKKEKAFIPRTTIIPAEADSTIKVVTPQAPPVQVTKGFDLPPPKDLSKVQNSSRSQSPASGRNTPSLSPIEGGEQVKKNKVAPDEQYQRARGTTKEQLYMVVIGHVDAGKSTLMGHLLYELGQVSQKIIHKYEQESRKLGKQSFVYAWVLDETGEERNRGITMDVARFQFDTKNKCVTLLDAPGHKDFIPNMISGAGQADVALLVVDATRGEFETGFDYGGQTREHALLVRALGVSQLAVAINKLDTVSWSQERFEEITKKLSAFLKQAGFKEKDVTYVPCSGLTGQNLVQKPTENELLVWYSGPCLLDVIDQFRSPERPVSKPFRLSINDIFKGVGSSFCVSGRIETGVLNVGDKVLVCPSKESAVVKSLSIEEATQTVVFAGDQATVTLSGIDIQHLSVGNILCDPQKPVQVTPKFEARIVIFNVAVPITKGYSVVLHHQSLVEPVIISKLVSQLNKSTGELVKKHPRFLTKNSSAIVEVTVSRPIALEPFNECKELGRVMFRQAGVTIAAGLITKVL